MTPYSIRLVMIVSLISILGFGCTGSEPKVPLGVKEGKLSACPSSPNCISTQAQDAEKRLPALAFTGSLDESRQTILSIVKSVARSQVLTTEETYLHIEFRSAFFRFVDDVEFFFDVEAGLIHFRSASRTGHSDFGVNRKRMVAISQQYSNRSDS